VQAEVYADGHDVIKASDVDAVLVTSWDPTHEGVQRRICSLPMAPAPMTPNLSDMMVLSVVL
jgi:hypothetical protein